MTFDELERAYSKHFMFDSRLQILAAHGWISLKGDQYVCTAKGRFFAKLIITLRRLYRIERAG